jgi:D-aminopeptidase
MTMRAASVLGLLLAAGLANADAPPRARDLGIPFDGVPGPLNAITDVAGVTVGHVTLVEDLPDDRAIRTGVTAILPRGEQSIDAHVFAGWFSLNGNGEMTGTTWLSDSGFLEGPVMLTNTHSVGAVHEGVIRWRVGRGDSDHTGAWWSLPVVAETWDGTLNDINGFHVRPEHAMVALDAAAPGPVTEGSVGGGTGMICYQFKCGIGTASRVTRVHGEPYTVGVLVQANFGSWELLRVAGIPVGPYLDAVDADVETSPEFKPGLSSIIIVVATDAPLLAHQLDRLAKRAALGLARNGSIASNGSGDIFIAFSTANEAAGLGQPDAALAMVPNDSISPLFRATVEATEEAIINALVAGRDMTGHDGSVVRGIDHGQLVEVLRRHGRLVEPAARGD